ncbi:hypothetical protein HD806DRAFT_542482 [Xylariaceae sp. AK1471]|nr:hypothetical protein HD806DRAFT_542482 [Xylariaceae sp. AK1471]
MSSKPAFPVDVAVLEEKVMSTVHTFIEVAVGLGTSLSALEHNTRVIFWWTSWAIGIVLGLFVLHQLLRVRAQLVQLNTYQAVFQRMWAEDRVNEDRIRKEERRERYIQEYRTVKTPREAMEAAAAQAQFKSYAEEILDAVGPIPPKGTPEYEDFLEYLREQMQQ